MRRTIISMLVFVLLVSITACSSPTNTPTETTTAATTTVPFNIEEYREIINTCRTDIYDSSILLSNMGKYEYNFMKALASVSGTPDDTVAEKAFEWLSENSDATKESVAEDYESIREQYKEIILIEASGKEAEELSDGLEDMYEAYTDLYTLVTEPHNYVSTFSSSYNDYIDTISACNEDLGLFLD